MKKHPLGLKFLPRCQSAVTAGVALAAFILCSSANGAAVLDEQFNYNDGNLDGQGGWTVTGGTAPATVEAGNLDVSGLDTSNGKQIQMDGSAGTFVKGNGSATLDTSASG